MTAFPDLIRQDGALTLSGCPEGYDSLIMADIARGAGLSLFVARDFSRMNAVLEALRFFAPDLETLTFPAWDCLPYDRMSPTPGVVAQRMFALSRLAERKDGAAPLLVVTTAAAAMQRVPPRAVIDEGRLSLRPGQTLDPANLETYFLRHGYTRVSTVSERGEFAVRGGLLDVFSPTHDEPMRLDFFGDSLESIRSFDAETQRSLSQIKRLDFTAVSEIRLDEAGVSRFRQGYLENFGASADDPMYAALSSGIRRQGVEHLLPLFYDRLDTLFDYLTPDAVVMLDALAENAVAERLASAQDAFSLRRDAAEGRYRALPPERLYLSEADWRRTLGDFRLRRFEPFAHEGGVDLEFVQRKAFQVGER